MTPDRPPHRPTSALVALVGTVVLLCGLVAACAPAASAVSAQDDAPAAQPPELTLELLFDWDALGALPRGLHWSPDGEALAYMWDDGDGTALWILTPGDGERRKVLSRLAEAAAEAESEDSEAAAENGRDEDGAGDDGLPRGLGVSWSPDGSTLLISAKGDLWTVAAEGGEARRMTDTEAEESEATWSPDGRWIAFIRDYDLHVMPASGNAEARALTTDGEENRILNGVTDWVYWEELWGRDSTGFWWSPDSTRIAYYRFDESPVGTYPLVDFTTVPYPTVEEQKYPKAGTDNPLVKLGVIDVEAGEESTVWLDTAGDEETYLARLHWRPDGGKVAVHRLNREQTDLDLLLCDPAGGGCEEILNEHWDTWVNLENDFAFLNDGRFVWGSERTGWRHLYLYAADGTLLRPLTTGDFAVTSLDGIDESRGRVVFSMFERGPLGAKDRLVAAVSLADPEGDVPPDVVPITQGAGWHAATVAANGNWVHYWSDADTPPTLVVRDAAGNEIAELPSRAPEFDAAALPAYRFFTIDGEDGAKLPAMMLTPPAVRSGSDEDSDAASDTESASGGHPAIMYHYGGPGSQVVANRWGRRSLWQKMMAQRGYASLALDNPASTYFGKRGEDRVHRRFGPLNLAAQEAGAAYLAGLPWVDGSRIGLWGWSGGGSNTLYCLFNSPGTWAAGMSGAPVTDWHLYDTIWTERYLDHPDDNAEGYEQSSAITHAEGLEDHLLVVHGTADDNVHPQNTLALADDLVKAGKPFEQAIYPRQKHGFGGKSQEHFYRLMTSFFERTLGSAEGDSAH